MTDLFQTSGTSPTSTIESLRPSDSSLAWFRGARLLKPIPVTSYAIAHDLWTIDPHIEDKRCYCYSCVEKRNSCHTPALKIETPPAPIAAESYIAIKHSITTTPLRENIFVRGKFVSGLPAKHSRFEFETRLQEQKIKKTWTGTIRARRNRFNNQTLLAEGTFDGPVVRIWHEPDHLLFEKIVGETQRQFEARVFAKPLYSGEHVVSIGNLRVPVDDIYSQGSTKYLLMAK